MTKKNKEKVMFRVLLSQFEKDENGNKTNNYKKTKIKFKENGKEKIKKIDMKGGIIVDNINHVLGYNYNDDNYDSNGNRLPHHLLKYDWTK